VGFCECDCEYSGSIKVGNFSLASNCHVFRPAVEPNQPAIQWVPGDTSPGLKQPENEADHSPPSIAEVRNSWSYITVPPVSLHGVVLS